MQMKAIAMIIPTLCRYNHFLECMESLKSNLYAKYFDVFIALDYPLSEKHQDGYNKICNYTQNGNFSMFAKFTVVRREKNLGPFLNEKKLLEEQILPNYDYWCRSDDDVVFSPNFLEYIYKCLMRYEKNQSVIAVAGYSYPCKYKSSENSNIIMNNAHLPMWGTAFWKDKYLRVREKIVDELYLHNEFENNLRKGNYKNLIDARVLDFIDGGLSWQNDKLVFDMTDVSLTTYIGLENLLCIYPVLSKVRNNGFDGSGFTCPNIIQDSFCNQQIDMASEFEIVEDTCFDLEYNRKVINRYDSRNKSQMFRAWLKVGIYKFVGKHIYKKYWYKRNKSKFINFIED